MSLEVMRPIHAVLLEVVRERQRQDEQWGDQTDNGDLLWNTILAEEVGEAAKDALDGDLTGLRGELVQVAAVAVAWAEALDRRRVGQ